MADKGFAKRFLETKWFGLVIGLAVFGLMFLLLIAHAFDGFETKVLDFNFRMKNPKTTARIQEGVTSETINPRISPDILIVGIDERALARFGRWPFPRYRTADLVNTFSRITNQSERERALFLDIFFNEPDSKSPQDDAAMVKAIRENGRVFLETVLQREEFPETENEEPFERQKILAERFGVITRIEGDWKKVDSFRGIKPPLAPYTRATYGYGHANYVQDDDQVYRRASLVVRASRFMEEIPIDELSPATPVDTAAFERFSWKDTHGVEHDVPVPLQDDRIEDIRGKIKLEAAAWNESLTFSDLTVELSREFGRSDLIYWQDATQKEHDIRVPLTPETLAALGKEIESAAVTLKEEAVKAAAEAGEQAAEVPTVDDLVASWLISRYTYKVTKYRDTWLPSLALALAAEHVHAKLSDVEVVLGKHVRIPSPQRYNVATKSWEPYSIITRPAKLDKAGNEVKPEQRKVLNELLIPIDERGQMLINFMGYPSSATYGASSTYPVRSYQRYAASPPGSDPATWVDTLGMANKIVMLGAFSQGMAEDQKPTPFGLMFGVEIHANALNTILMGNFLRYAPFWLSLLILFGMVMLTAFMTGRLSTVWSLVALAVALVAYFGAVLFVFDFGNVILPLIAPLFGAFLCFLAVEAYRTVFAEKDKRRNKAIFSKIVDPALLEQILEHPPELGGQDKELTVFFSDIRDFSSIAEKMTSQELVNYLNRYFTVMTDLIKEYGGTQDKLMGDAVMGFWGAPMDQADHALLACKCALKQMAALGPLNEEWKALGQQTIDIGIGISTGTMTAAYMGSKERLAYTVIGDAVNLGSRLEGANKAYYNPGKGYGHFSRILISENTYEQVKDRVIARELDVVRVKGKQEPAVIYELIDVVGGFEPPKPPRSKGKILYAEAKADRRERAAKARAKRR